MGNDERATKLENIRTFPQQLRNAIIGKSDKQLTTRFIADQWSVAQIVHHCADSHINGYIRLKLMLTEDRPALKPYDQPSWASMPDAQEVDLSYSLAILDGVHHRWSETVAALDPDQWERVGLHGELGEITVSDLVDMYDNHCRVHLEQIRLILAAEPSRIDHVLRHKHIKLMRYNIETVDHLISSISAEDATSWRDSGDGWTVLEVLCHLRDFDRFFRQRVELMLAEDNPQLPAFDHEQIAIDGRYNEQDIDVVMIEFSAERAIFVQLFYDLFETPEAWSRPGIHPEAGDWTIFDSLLQVGHHDANHIEQMTRIMKEKKTAP